MSPAEKKSAEASFLDLIAALEDTDPELTKILLGMLEKRASEMSAPMPRAAARASSPEPQTKTPKRKSKSKAVSPLRTPPQSLLN